MPIEVRGVQLINELLNSVTDAPDFSFLNDWRPDTSATFFPRLNNSPEAKKTLNGDDRQKLRVAIDSVLEVNDLIDDAELELVDPKSGFSNAISVFHRDGEVSVVAIPVNEHTSKALGGFLFAHDIWNVPNAKLFLSDLKMLTDLTPSAEGYLKWRWWPVNKETRQLNKRNAAQLLLAATNPGNRNVHYIAELVDSRAQLSAGRINPVLTDWQQALLKLDSLNELPDNAVVSTIDFVELPNLKPAIQLISSAFAVRDEYMVSAKRALENLAESRVQVHVDNLSLDEFAKKVKGKGFALKRLKEIADVEVYGHLATQGVGETSHSVGDIMRLKARASQFFYTKQLKASLQLMQTYIDDQKRLLGYPRLTDTDAAFEEFLRLVYRYYIEQQRPYPVRSQFDALEKLLETEPNQLHLIARNEEAIRKLVGSMESYLEEDRLKELSKEHFDPTVQDARDFFKENPATYQAVLSSMGLHALTLEQISGFLAPELTASIRELEIDLSGMKSPLRSYQHFGVQYALNQKRIILGDEMGLGKTVTSLALANHLANEGDRHFLTILPLAVLENWRLETLKHTEFTPVMLYGDELEDNLQQWVTEGGFALATYESIQKVNQSSLAASLPTPALVIVDEAHFLKNPETLRARNSLPWMRASERLVMLTGTPLENKLEEFETMIHYAQPQLPIPENKLAFAAFRKAIAPVYLRRNQVDVLHELPELQDDEEYIELSEADKEYYTRFLKARDWNGARRAKILAGNRSSTVQRIQTIVNECMENNHKVLIFSYYRETIDVLRRVLKHDDPYIPLTGSISSVERQAEVQKFTKSEKPGVLLAQATAGGTGLNIQAASVVIIVEPQAKPSIEEQMIRRAYRMGQTKAVRVIRMRGKNTIDERWVKLQEGKRKIFDATAAVSDAAALDKAVESVNTKDLLEQERAAWGV